MKTLLLGVVCVAGFGSVQASLFSFDFPGGVGDGGQETTPNESIGMVMSMPPEGITYDDVSNLLSVSAFYHDLGSTVIAAHVHGTSAPDTAGGPGSNADIKITLTHTGGTAGTLAGSDTISEADEINLLAGLWYVNVHTLNFSGGEVRGQLLPTLVAVPEPEAYAAFAGAALLAVGIGRRLRRRSE